MVALRKSEARGIGEHGWLHSRHTFSFANYFDPEFMGFRSLRVINEDRVEPGRGFGRHGHRNMEIFSWVVDGRLAHEDSEGHKKTIGPGCLQYMSAGSGIRHSEFNASESERVHFYQVWIEPSEEETPPTYEDRDFTDALDRGGWVLLLSPDGAEESFRIRQDARVYAARMKSGDTLEHRIGEGRGVWVQVVRGSVEVNGEHLEAGDGASLTDEQTLRLKAMTAAEVLLIDLP